MFHAGTPDSVKKHILDNLSQADGHIRVIACTIAFGMGVNCKGVHRIIHFGPSKNLECYVQECRRTGRDGEPSSCLLLHNGLLGAHCMDDIKEYTTNTTDCRRTSLYRHFPGKFTFSVMGHQCCDICAKSCSCGQETCSEPAKFSFPANSDVAMDHESVRLVKEKDKQILRNELFSYMKKLLHRNASGAVASVNIMHEFTPFHIQQVLENCDKIKTISHIEQMVEVWRKEHSRAILRAISKTFRDVDENEMKTLENEEEEDEFAQEWADIRDDSELWQLLSESDLQNLDVHMEEIDQSGTEQRNISSIINNLFKSF